MYVCQTHLSVVIKRMSKRSVGAGGALMLALFALTPGCRKEEIRAYRVPKEKPLIASSGVREDPPAAMPQLEWKLPAGWEERGPGRMSVVASFWIPSKAGPGAEVSVMPMPGESASNLSLLVNIVRQGDTRSEEHTSELQSPCNLVCRLLLEKKKKK